MKAAQLVGFREPLKVGDVADPIPGDGDVVIAVEASGICRTDWHAWNGDWEWVGMVPVLPLTMGHEIGGTVVAVGKAVTKVAVDDRVTVPFHESCGACRYCREARSNLCDHMEFLGLTHNGGYAQFAVIRNADYNCVNLPDELDALSAAAMGCRYMTAFHAVTRRGALTPGDWVVVLGCGGVGLSAVQIASALGGRVIAVDISDVKLKKAKEEGALVGVDARTDDIAEVVRDVTGGGADIGIGGIGLGHLIGSGIQSLRKGGRLVQVGLTSKDEQGWVRIPIDYIIESEIEIVGSVGNPHVDYPRLLGLVESQVLRPARLVSKTVALGDASDVIAGMDSYDTLGFEVITVF